MNNPSISLRFGILLEAYCRGIGGHLKGLIRQVEALEKLTKLTDALKVKRDDPLKVKSISCQNKVVYSLFIFIFTGSYEISLRVGISI